MHGLNLGDFIRHYKDDTTLEGFHKILLQPGETKEVKFVIRPEQLSFIGRDNKRIIEPGQFKIMISNLSKEFTLE